MEFHKKKFWNVSSSLIWSFFAWSQLPNSVPTWTIVPGDESIYYPKRKMKLRIHGSRLAHQIAMLCFLHSIHEARLSASHGRVVLTAQGRMEGRMVSEATADFAAVDAFLGVAYAAPPVGHLRFMPPTSPRAWSGINQNRDFKPVCPQVLPKNVIGNKSTALKYMTSGRLEYMRRLVPYLEDQSEDCLYLNIYAPRHGKKSVCLRNIFQNSC